MLSSVDLLVFDIDGVLLDTSKSFPEVIRLAVIEGFERFCGGISDFPCPIDEHFRIFKREGHFNDDYNISWTLACMAAAKGSSLLSECFPKPEEVEEALKSFKEPLREWVTQTFTNKIPYAEYRELCSELYRGRGGKKGLYTLEIPMLHVNWKHLPLPVAIYTGRDDTETEMALRTLGWRDFPREFIISSSTGIDKPSPEGLELLCKRTGSDFPCYFGDTASDMKAQEAYGRGMFIAIGDLLPEADNSFANVADAVRFVLG